MSKYEFLLFDLDETLLDFKKTELTALKSLFDFFDVELTKEIFDSYVRENALLWENYAKNSIDIFELRKKRFERTLEPFGYKVDGPVWELQYELELSKGGDVIEGAVDLCEKLSPLCKFYAVTNGIAFIQKKRMKNSGLEPFFIKCFDSQTVGAQKPTTAFFDVVSSNIEGFKKEKALLIGDSLTADIQGAINYGLDSCWFNPSSKPSNGLKPTYEIKALKELLSIVC